MVYNLKPKGAEKTSSKIQNIRRVTYDYNGKAVVRLQDQRDITYDGDPK